MVSVADLLNPEPPRAPLPTFRPLPVSPAQRTVGLRSQPISAKPSIETFRMLEDTKNTPRCKTRPVMNFAPFEPLDESSLREVRRFQVHPLGSIQETGERIPYNSGKKDFFTKTGREGFEVFHYDFKVPGDDNNYTVMWDYSVGLVRMTSFFKCRGYSKTTPAKMLNLNPGLKDITYSITGGSIKAQGYWMPYSCAKAICATFCYEIAGALIPLFGPHFPFECIPETAHGYGRMVISPEIVEQAKNDAIARFKPPATLPSPRPSRSVSPLPSQRSTRIAEPYDYHSGYDRRALLSPYTDTDVDYLPTSGHSGCRLPTMTPQRIPDARPPTGSASVPTPQSSPAWTAVNRPPPQALTAYHNRGISHLHEGFLSLHVSATASPWLSAIPRSLSPGAAGNTSNWQSHQPRSHYPNHHQYTRDTPPSVSSASVPERGIDLAPLRLKRRYSEVDDVPDTHHDPHPLHYHHHNNNINTPTPITYTDYNPAIITTSEDDGEYDVDDDVIPSHVSSTSASASPQSVAAPPPTPTPAWSPGGNHQGATATAATAVPPPPPHSGAADTPKTTAKTMTTPKTTAKTMTTPKTMAKTMTTTTVMPTNSVGDASQEEDEQDEAAVSPAVSPAVSAFAATDASAATAAVERRASERDAALMLMQMHMYMHVRDRDAVHEGSQASSGRESLMVHGEGEGEGTEGGGGGGRGGGVGAVSARPSSWAPAASAAVPVVAAAAVVGRTSPVAKGPTTRSKRRRTLER